MKILIMDSTLTVITSMDSARKVLEVVRKQGVQLSFDTGTFSQAFFTPLEADEWTIWEPDTSMDIPVEFQPSLCTDEDYAVKRLYRLRKYYNRKWRD